MADRKENLTYSSASRAKVPTRDLLTLDTLLEEYKQMREEIRVGTKYVQDIANFTVILFGGLAAYLATAWPSDGSDNNTLLPWMLLMAPVLFLILVWLGFGMELFIRRTARFQETYLRPRIVNICKNRDILGWEHWTRDECPPGFYGFTERMSFPPDHWPRYALVLLPGLATLAAFVLFRLTRTSQYVLCICPSIDWTISIQWLLLIFETVIYVLSVVYVFRYQEPKFATPNRREQKGRSSA